MRRRWWVLGPVLLSGCVQVEPSGELFAPAPGSDVAVVATPAAGETAAAEPVDGFDFAADGRDGDEGAAPGEDDGEVDLERLAAGLGMPDVPLDTTPPPSAPAPTAAPVPPVGPVTAVTPAPWSPGTPLEGSFGVRLISTVLDGSPPRAILGLPSGEELVVKPGSMLVEQRLVVLAIGDNVVQVAEFLPTGDHARVQTQLLTALYGDAPAPR